MIRSEKVFIMAKSKKSMVNKKKAQKARSMASSRTAPKKKSIHVKPKGKPVAHKGKANLKIKASLHKPAKELSKIEKRDIALKEKKKEEGRKKVNVSIAQPEEVKLALERLLTNSIATEYLKKNVSKMAVDVIGMLVTPKTDEFLAEQLDMKINAIRRILNIMQGYGITNYYISKNTKGWLSFAWYINTSKLTPFLDYVEGMERERSIITEACNDYFICEACYKNDKFVFTFDSAFENNFKCTNCSKGLSRKNKDEVTVLVNTVETIRPV